ncbi:MAG: A/G-specific adenine glycosylase [Myxococcota bacterium]|nr:A/G-specific adenine glycosylase [Myxococcota bacterium]
MDAFTTDLLAWYDTHRRSLPWRDTVTPYRTWISEVMLQQTRVDTVLPYFARFMSRFPTVERLADAEQDEVMSMWSGLGYYSRARNMHAAAKAVVALGAFPTTLKGVRALPGVGEYMAGAIGSIALGLDVAAVDGNLHRVLARIHRSTTDRKGAWSLAAAHLPAGRAGDYNQALMDLGSGTCKPRRAECPRCPVSAHCAAFAAGDVHKYPVKAKKKVTPRREAVCGVLRREGRVLIVRRPAAGLYGGMYELPGILLNTGEAPDVGLRRAFSERLGLTIAPGGPLGRVQHTLTHMKLTLHILDIPTPASATPTLSHYTDARWITPTEPGDIGISTLAAKALAVAAKPEPQRMLF